MGYYFTDPSDGMLYKMTAFGPVLVGKSHGYYEDGEQYDEDEDL